MFSKLKQFKDLRSKAKTLQAQLAAERVEGSAGFGKVKIRFDGNQRATAVEIAPNALNDHQALPGLVKAAINDGMEKLQTKIAHTMKETGGMDVVKDLQTLLKK